MSNKLMYLPLDERPCNYIYPEMIINISDIEMLIPPIYMLGRKKEPADVDRLWEWIYDSIGEVNYLVVSIDMLIFGGIVPSRLHEIPEEKCIERLKRLTRLKEINPDLKIYGFNLITRVPSYNSADEEPDYYEIYGEKIFKIGQLTDMADRGTASYEDKKELEVLKNKIPEGIFQDYINRRKVNHRVNLEVVNLVHKGIIDFLIIPMDDCSKYGFSAMERRRIMENVRKLDLLDRVYVYPGADEVGCTLCARAFCDIKNYRPAVFVRYSSASGSTVVPRFEDRSINETIKYHIIAAGAIEADNSLDAEFVLMVNPPTENTIRNEMEWEAAIKSGHINDAERNLNEFVEAIDYYLKKGKLCAVGDSARPNGSDNDLMNLLKKYGLLDKLLSYGGWNTSSNTLGTVISHSIVSSYFFNKGSLTEEQRLNLRKFLFLRYLEDWGYQSNVRAEVTADLGKYNLNYFDLMDKERLVSDMVKGKLKRFVEQNLDGFNMDFDIYMPWNRMFETGILIK